MTVILLDVREDDLTEVYDKAGAGGWRFEVAGDGDCKQRCVLAEVERMGLRPFSF